MGHSPKAPDKDPVMLVREVVNLMNLYRDELVDLVECHYRHGELGQMLSSLERGTFTPWIGRSCRVTSHGSRKATVKALKKVGGFFLVGVEFSRDQGTLMGGHDLSMRTSGREGSPGYCLWVWPGELVPDPDS